MTPYYEDGSVQLFNGDNREILPSLGSVDHCITDPPYSRWTHEKQRTGATMPDTKGSALAGRRVGAACLARYRDLGFDALTPSMAFWCGNEFARLVKRWCVIFTDAENQRLWQRACARGGLEHVRVGAWVKLGSTPQFTGDRPGTGFEALEIAHPYPPGRKRWNGGGRPAVWTHAIVLNRHGVERVHTTQKPEPLMRDLVLDFTDVGETILDAFAGSGTLGVAAKQCGRKAVLIEVSESDCAQAAKRLEATYLDERIALVPGQRGIQGALAW